MAALTEQQLATGYKCKDPCPVGFVQMYEPSEYGGPGGCFCRNPQGRDTMATTESLGGICTPIALLGLAVLPGWWKLLAVLFFVEGSPWPKGPDGTPVCKRLFYGGL